MITNKERHKNISYHSDTKEASKRISHANFVSLDEIDNEFYEVTAEKTKIVLNIPVVLGFSVLQYTKLKMSQFYYDCIITYRCT